MRKTALMFVVAALSLTAFWACKPAVAADADLTSHLVQALGVTQEQAQGGAGSILKYAKDKLSGDDFAKVAAAVPDTNALLSAAPSISGLGSAFGNIGGIASLAGSFQQLGLSKEMVGKFVPEILSYVESKGGTEVSNILASALK